MAKPIFRNDKGMSLIEVIVASAISVVIGMGVMKINETATKGMASMKANSDIEDLRNSLRIKFSKENTCAQTQYNSSTVIGANLDIASNASLNKIQTPFSPSEPELQVGQNVKAAPAYIVSSITMKAFDNGATTSNTGSCDIEIKLTKFAGEKKLGGRERTIILPMMCQVSGSVVQDCQTVVDDDEEGWFWKTNTAGSFDFIKYTGHGAGNGMVKIGESGSGTISDANVRAALTLDPGTDSGSKALQIQDGAWINWSNTTSNGVYIYGSSNTIYTNGSFTADVKVTAPDIHALDMHAGTFHGGSGEFASIGVNGDMAANGNSYANNHIDTSDKRYKKDIQKVADYSEKLSKIRGVTYFMRKDEFLEKNFDERRQFGVIAQEVQEVFPNLVFEINDDGYLGVNYTGLIPLLIDQSNRQKDQISKNKEMLSVMQNGFNNVGHTLIKHENRIEILEKENKALKAELKEIKEKINEILLFHKED